MNLDSKSTVSVALCSATVPKRSLPCSNLILRVGRRADGSFPMQHRRDGCNIPADGVVIAEPDFLRRVERGTLGVRHRFEIDAREGMGRRCVHER